MRQVSKQWRDECCCGEMMIKPSSESEEIELHLKNLQHYQAIIVHTLLLYKTKITDHGLRAVNALKHLCVLDVSYCNIIGFHHLRHHHSLHTICARFCNELQPHKLKDLRKLKTLRTLDISNCNRFTSLSCLSQLKQLTSLDISCCKASWLELQHIADLTNLRALHLRGWTRLKDGALCYIAKLKKLEVLDLYECSMIKGDGFVHLIDLENIAVMNLGKCSALKDITSLSFLVSLRTLNLENCFSLTPKSIRFINQNPGLCILNLDLDRFQHHNFSADAIEDYSALNLGLTFAKKYIDSGNQSSLKEMHNVNELDGGLSSKFWSTTSATSIDLTAMPDTVYNIVNDVVANVNDMVDLNKINRKYKYST